MAAMKTSLVATMLIDLSKRKPPYSEQVKKSPILITTCLLWDFVSFPAQYQLLSTNAPIKLKIIKLFKLIKTTLTGD